MPWLSAILSWLTSSSSSHFFLFLPRHRRWFLSFPSLAARERKGGKGSFVVHESRQLPVTWNATWPSHRRTYRDAMAMMIATMSHFSLCLRCVTMTMGMSMEAHPFLDRYAVIRHHGGWTEQFCFSLLLWLCEDIDFNVRCPRSSSLIVWDDVVYLPCQRTFPKRPDYGVIILLRRICSHRLLIFHIFL